MRLGPVGWVSLSVSGAAVGLVHFSLWSAVLGFWIERRRKAFNSDGMRQITAIVLDSTSLIRISLETDQKFMGQIYGYVDYGPGACDD